MKLSKTEIKYLGVFVLVFAGINVAANMVGLWIPRLVKVPELSHIESIFKEIVRPLFLQTLLFAVCSGLAFAFLKNKKLARYGFALFQLVVFHVIFFLNLKSSPVIHFFTKTTNLGLKYLSNFGQYLVDLLYLRIPINGNFENGMFLPFNTGKFYLHWILLNVVYYFVVSWLAVKLTNVLTAQKEPLPEALEPEN